MSEPRVFIFDETEKDPNELPIPADKNGVITLVHVGGEDETEKLKVVSKGQRNVYIVDYRPFPGGGGWELGFEIPYDFIKYGLVITISAIGVGALQKIGADLVDYLKKLLPERKEVTKLHRKTESGGITVVIPPEVSEDDVENIVRKVNKKISDDEPFVELVYDRKKKDVAELPRE